ncbi:MAG: hypothetical protein ACRDLL_03925 [Solirubrobacterales bacterium]
MLKTTVLVAALAIFVVLVAGCGEGEGVAGGATVAAYVEASMCRGAKEELASKDSLAGDVHVKAICLPSSWSGKKLDLATVGANARRATEDSTTVAFLEAPNERASRFTHPILGSAEIAWIASSSGKTAMAQLLRAIEAAGSSGNLREKLHKSLG